MTATAPHFDADLGYAEVIATSDPTPEEIAELLAGAPEPEPFTDAEMDAMYQDWCAREEARLASADGHKDHHHWAA